jgi:CheY-like chemotaxis protein
MHKQILLADDSFVDRTVLATILAGIKDTHVTVAEDGLAAWNLLDDPSRSFDVAFIDLQMPKLDGFDLVQRIHEDPMLKSLHIVLCTVAHDRATVLKAREFGVHHYLVKPCTETAVREKLQQLGVLH